MGIKVKGMNLEEIVNTDNRTAFYEYCRKVLCTQRFVPNTDSNRDKMLSMGRPGCDDMMWMWVKLFTSSGTYPNKGGRIYNQEKYEEIANNAILGVHLVYEAWYSNRRLNPCFVFDVMDLCGIAYEEDVNVYTIAKIVKSVLTIAYKNSMPYYTDNREFQAQQIIIFYGWLRSGYCGVTLAEIFDKLSDLLDLTNRVRRYRNIEYNAYFPTWEEMCACEEQLERILEDM